ncbi:MAG: tripartite tricarboxylate transporter substrate binding protein [Proteobacteria bacterium]|nr:tripartite tricarboxylate transporter substrate binding protein [Pseudomonadota bacterium]
MMNWLRVALFGAGSVLCVAAAMAQGFPSKPLRIVVPFSPGGTADVLARIIGQKMSDALGQQVLVENRPGGGTVIGTEFTARAPADGHTMLVMANSFTINPAIRDKLPYDPFKDFAPVTLLVKSPQVLVVGPTMQVKTLAEFSALVKSRPGKFSLATVGPATTQHIASEMLKSAMKLEMIYVPYPGGAPAMTALGGGHVDAVLANYSEVAPHVTSGKARAIAVTSLERTDTLKDVPTVSESGYPDFEAAAWFGLVVTGGSPPAAVARLNAEANKALKLPDVREKLIAQGMYPVGMTPGEFDAHIRAEMGKYAKVIKEAGIKVD